MGKATLLEHFLRHSEAKQRSERNGGNGLASCDTESLQHNLERGRRLQFGIKLSPSRRPLQIWRRREAP